MTKVLEDLLATETKQYNTKEIAAIFDEVVAKLYPKPNPFCLKIGQTSRRLEAREFGELAHHNGKAQCAYCTLSNGTNPPCGYIGDSVLVLENDKPVKRSKCMYGIDKYGGI